MKIKPKNLLITFYIVEYCELINVIGRYLLLCRFGLTVKKISALLKSRLKCINCLNENATCINHVLFRFTLGVLCCQRLCVYLFRNLNPVVHFKCKDKNVYSTFLIRLSHVLKAFIYHTLRLSSVRPDIE